MFTITALMSRNKITISGTIQVIANPAIKQRQHDRIAKHWRDYRPTKEEWAKIQKEHRRYKQDLYLKGELK